LLRTRAIENSQSHQQLRSTSHAATRCTSRLRPLFALRRQLSNSPGLPYWMMKLFKSKKMKGHSSFPSTSKRINRSNSAISCSTKMTACMATTENVRCTRIVNGEPSLIKSSCESSYLNLHKVFCSTLLGRYRYRLVFAIH